MAKAVSLPNPFKYMLVRGQWLVPWRVPQCTDCLNTVGTPGAYLGELCLSAAEESHAVLLGI